MTRNTNQLQQQQLAKLIQTHLVGGRFTTAVDVASSLQQLANTRQNTGIDRTQTLETGMIRNLSDRLSRD